MSSERQKSATETASATARSAKRANFERLAKRRVNEALKTIKLIGNLSNRRNYDYTDDHARQIIEALDAELRAVKTKFAEERRNSENFFEFKL